jgi:hypothetical protein
METTNSVGGTMNVHTVEPKAREPILSKHTSRFPAPRQGLDISLVVTTHQVGKLDPTREDEGNADFRSLLAHSYERPWSALAAAPAALRRAGEPAAIPAKNQHPSMIRT